MKIGIVGAGQLAQMLALAAIPIGIEVLCLAEDNTKPAATVTDIFIGELNSPQKLHEFAEHVDVITYENENIPVDAIRSLAEIVPVYPSIKALQTTQDRLLEKQLFDRLNIPTVKYAAIDSMADLQQASEHIGLPAVLKTRRFGYDGKGQYRLANEDDCQSAWKTLGEHPLIFENFIAFETEVSLISARDQLGNTHYYPLIENMHKDGILRLSYAPWQNNTLQAQAERYAQRLLDELDYIGVMTIEFFVVNNQLLANEIAPRVHNSGHWTINGAATSQFENHVRAISNLALGQTGCLAPSAMINMIGELNDRDEVLKIPNAHFYDYAKSPRPNRKLGHINLVDHDKKRLQASIDKIQTIKC